MKQHINPIQRVYIRYLKERNKRILRDTLPSCRDSIWGLCTSPLPDKYRKDMQLMDIFEQFNLNDFFKAYFNMFLKSENAYDIFYSNIDINFSSVHVNYPQNVDDFFNKASVAEFVILAFSWDKSPQGYNYWASLHRKWEQYLDVRLDQIVQSIYE